MRQRDPSGGPGGAVGAALRTRAAGGCTNRTRRLALNMKEEELLAFDEALEQVLYGGGGQATCAESRKGVVPFEYRLSDGGTANEAAGGRFAAVRIQPPGADRCGRVRGVRWRGAPSHPTSSHPTSSHPTLRGLTVLGPPAGLPGSSRPTGRSGCRADAVGALCWMRLRMCVGQTIARTYSERVRFARVWLSCLRRLVQRRLVV